MKNLITRSLTGLIYVACLVGAILGGHIWFWILLTIFAVLGIGEFNRLSNNHSVSTTTSFFDVLMAILALGGVSAFLYSGNWSLPLCAMALYLLCLAVLRPVLQLYIHDKNPLAHLVNSIFGQIYIVLPLTLLLMLYGFSNKYFILNIFILTWVSDTGAYCVGSMLGKHRLFPRISPKKSWEGFAGGLFFCLLGAFLLYRFCPGSMIGLNLWQSLTFGAIVCIFGTWGDLVESMIKRSIGVKDSGNILPGHGGILDRIDSLLIAVPAVAFFIFLLKIL